MPEETKEAKKSKWTKCGDLATIEMPSGLSWTFDFSKLPNEPYQYYGKKQWVSDKGASEKGTTDEERLELMKDAFREACEKGVEVSEDGRVFIVGKERANAAPVKQELKQAKDLLGLLAKQAAGEELSEEESTWVSTMLANYKK